MINNISKTRSTFRLVTGITTSLLAIYLITQEPTMIFGCMLLSLSGILVISGLFRSCPITYIRNKRRE